MLWTECHTACDNVFSVILSTSGREPACQLIFEAPHIRSNAGWHRACFSPLLRAPAGLGPSFSRSEGEFCRISFTQCQWSLIFSSHSTESTELKMSKKKKKKPESWQRKIAIQSDWTGQSSQLLCLNLKNAEWQEMDMLWTFLPLQF